MAIAPLDLQAEHQPLRDALLEAWAQVLDSGAFVLGPAVSRFEAAMADYCQVRHAIGVSSGTDALVVALKALGVEPGDEVICPAFTFFATAGAIWRTGGRPVFVDIDPATFNIDPERIASAITARTKAIIPVHLFGQCADMQAIAALAAEHHLAVIEDAAQATGARDGQRPAGSMGDLGCLSFYPTKNLGGFGEGGMVLTNEDELAEKCRFLRNHGQVDAYRHDYVGGNYRMDSLQAAALLVKLPLLDQFIAARRRLAERYCQHLADLPLILPQTAPRQFHTFNQFTVRLPDDRRDAFCEHLRRCGIGHKVYYPLPLHLQPCFDALGYREGDLPETEKACRQVVSIALYPQMTDQQQDQVIAAIRDFFAA